MSDVREFGAKGDGKHDDSQAIAHALQKGDGVLRFSRGEYRMTQTIQLDLAQSGRVGIDGEAGTAKIIMAGAGPAFRVVGTHAGTAHPPSVNPEVWASQRMPTFKNIEIEGAHAQADGIEIRGAMQPILEAVALRGLRHAVRITGRNRNVLISHCQIYHNMGVGVFLDTVNLHQMNIVGSHISYNRLGGIRIERSEIRNLQITGNDIEYNTNIARELGPEQTAEIYVDTTAPKATVNEVAIASNTIQATLEKGGANIRIINKPSEDLRPGLWAITGNIIGSQEINVHLIGCHGFVFSGNCIYSCGKQNLLADQCSKINLTGNNFRRHEPKAGVGVRFVDSHDCIISGCHLQDESETGQASGASLLELVRCKRFTIGACQFLDGVPYNLDIADSSQINIAGCMVMETRPRPVAKGSFRWAGEGQDNLVLGNQYNAECHIDLTAGVTAEGNHRVGGS